MARQASRTASVVAVVAAGTALVGGLAALGLAGGPKKGTSGPSPLPSDDWATTPSFTEADIEAGARMLASENPRGSRALHIEQVHTQLRAAKPGESLYDRTTAGSGWGPQGERAAGGGVRPVSTTQPATAAHRDLVRRILAGQYRSHLPGARRFFEPAAQDRAFAIAERARQKQHAGETLTPQESRLLKYRRNAQQVRAKWLSEGSRFLERIDSVEFYS